MPWKYSQLTDQLTRNNKTVATGYSGKGAGKNNSAMESVSAMGPIPRGRYRIGPQYKHPSKGDITMALTPVGHVALGRSHFLIHGDSVSHPGGASEGCVILNRTARQTIASSGDNELEVIK